MIRSMREMAELVREYGILPVFSNSLPGFSVEEHAAGEVWFPEDGEGIWEWKGQVIRETGAAYGKFFHGKVGYIMPELFPDFANWRRGGYDFDARYEEGLAGSQEKMLYDIVAERGSMRTGELRRAGGFGKEKKGGFESALSRLQAQCYLITIDFEYRMDSFGRQYGWGEARLSTPEAVFGPDFVSMVYSHSPDESYRRVFRFLRRRLPGVDENTISQWLK